MEQSSNRTYRLRGSRITGPQQSALDKYWGTYGHEYSTELLNITSLFPTAEQVVLEIGFGMGEATALIARDFPSTGLGLSNTRIIEGDAHPIITTMIPDNSIDGVHLFFPDPWPKKRHHKRRIINAEFLALIYPKIKDGGFFHVATDWVPYAEQIQEVFEASPLFAGGVVERPEWRPVTRFEGQGITKDHQVTDLRYTKS
jgi:tRNA (guanine-N7-)-methyltransferase